MIASPVAVPPLGCRRVDRVARRPGGRWSGLQHARGVWLKATTPTRTLLGHLVEEALGGARGRRSSRLGLTSVACIEPEWSVASMTDALLDRHGDRLLRLGQRDDQRGERERVERAAARGGASPGGRGATDGQQRGGGERRAAARAARARSAT